MSKIIFRNGTCVGDYLKPYIVAELNTSHFGDIDLAKEMINQAKFAGCDCVKFQSWSADSLYSSGYYKKNPIAKRFVDKFSITNSEFRDLVSHAKNKKIDFASTPYSIDEARFLVDECDVPFIKIASMELNNLPYLKQLAELNVPLVLSTGMGTLEEIVRAVAVIESTGNLNLIILHCTSVYPAPPETIRLQNILGLRARFPNFPIGYSDHTIGSQIPVASVAYGSCLIEKHFTLDNERIGMDNQMATEPLEMQKMVDDCLNVYASLGGVDRVLGENETAQIPIMRRSMVARNNINAGEFLKEDDIEFKRPGNGIPPDISSNFIGRKINKNIDAGSTIFETDFT